MSAQMHLLREAKPVMRCHGCDKALENGETILVHVTKLNIAFQNSSGRDIAISAHVGVYCVQCIDDNARAFSAIRDRIEHERLGLKEGDSRE